MANTSLGGLRTLGLLTWAAASCVPATHVKVATAKRVAPAVGALAEGAPRAPLVWAELNAATFAKAKAEQRFIVLDGSAEWCHWCHVMEATTYHDPAVAALLAAHFIMVKVDVDERPDIQERYADWGWPATVLFSPEATEIGKYRGYIAPADFVEILRDVVQAGTRAPADDHPRVTPLTPGRGKLDDATLAFIERDTELGLDEYYDEEQGGWGRSQKAPIAADNAWALRRAADGDAMMQKRVLFTLAQQAGVLDPVWGGIYQYSVGHDWVHPHFEKLMPFEAGALDNYASAYALTGDPLLLATARSIRGYIDAFLLAPDGAFYASQDADVNAHDPSKPFVSGHELYALENDARRQKGIPRVDRHEYAHENGLAIAAYVTLYEATCGPLRASAPCDRSSLETAEKAAARVLATHLSASGAVAHDAAGKAHVFHLADNAGFGYALARLYEANHDVSARDAATKIAHAIARDFADPSSSAYFTATEDPDAVGVFARRRIPFEDNVMVVRLFAKLALVGAQEERKDFAALAEKTLEAIARPEDIRARGRMIGDFLLAIEDIKALRRRP